MKKTTSPKLAKVLASCSVPHRHVALAWLGQAGFVLKSPRGALLAIDPYLSNSCAAVGAPLGINMNRQIPPPLLPWQLVGFHGLIFSHSHQDHIDPETIKPYLQAGGAGPFVAPHEASERLKTLGVREEDILLTWPNRVHRIEDFTLKATFAIPLGGDDLTHVGYLVEVQNGPRIYFTGDTDYNEILPLSVAPYKPDIMVTVINPAFRNLSPVEAARLAKAIGPKKVIPCHHDLFPDNSLSERLLWTNLVIQGIPKTFYPLKHGKVHLLNDRRKKPALA